MGAGFTVDDVILHTHDGERLAATLYLPDGDGPFASVMEALPYRKDDVTESYRATYARYAAHGLAVLRLDLRGTGSSTGIAIDEYADVERADLRTVIEWLASQPWSNGRVGMFGTSYSGFNSLQMAADGVPQLRAVVATYATDDRYTDDVHYCGGVLRAIDLIDYPLYMIAMNALPPVPAVFGEGWRDEWRRRVEQTPPWLAEWLAHPIDAPTWRRGSIRLGPNGSGYARMACPTMLIVGWADGYRNNSFRVVEQYAHNELPWRMLAGPWVHKSPERARPGPNVDDDRDVLAFFDHHLRDGPVVAGAPGQVYVRAPVRPEPDLAFHPGRWVDVATWPAPDLRHVAYGATHDGIDSLVVEGDVGVAAWNSCAGGLPWGQPLDQRADNARSLTYDWRVDERDELVGVARVVLRVRSDRPYGHVSVKLCDVMPDGSSALITRGMLDLRHRGCWPADSHGEVGRSPQPLTPGEWIEIELELEATTWTLEPGHGLRLAVAGSDWPNCWPPPGPLTLDVDAGALELVLPLVVLPDSTHDFAPGSGPAPDEAEGVVWRIEHDVLGRETRVATRYGGTYDGMHGAVITDDYSGELGVSTVDPARSWARGCSTYLIEWPEGSARTEASLEVTSDTDTFEVVMRLRVHDGDHELADRTWHMSLPREQIGRPAAAGRLRSRDSHRGEREHDMGWMANKQAEAAALLQQVIEPSVPSGETLTGCVYANKRSSFSAKLYAIGVTDQHMIIQEVDRKWKPVGAPLIAAPADVKVGNIFSEGAMWTLSDKDQEIRFEAKGDDYKLMVLGGTLFENALAGGQQVDGLQALVTFLRSAPKK